MKGNTKGKNNNVTILIVWDLDLELLIKLLTGWTFSNIYTTLPGDPSHSIALQPLQMKIHKINCEV